MSRRKQSNPRQIKRDTFASFNILYLAPAKRRISQRTSERGHIMNSLASRAHVLHPGLEHHRRGDTALLTFSFSCIVKCMNGSEHTTPSVTVPVIQKPPDPDLRCEWVSGGVVTLNREQRVTECVSGVQARVCPHGSLWTLYSAPIAISAESPSARASNAPSLRFKEELLKSGCVLRFRLPQCDPQGLLHIVGIKRCSITQFSVSASKHCIFADFGARIVSSNAVIQGVSYGSLRIGCHCCHAQRRVRIAIVLIAFRRLQEGEGVERKSDIILSVFDGDSCFSTS
ncbi:hypothetical protein E1301_Tti016541 [Triplophysa tibetana]|uniref:Uncharacterized protein n=1 Tax=Triplophysa tibetana TaxID=1572043 RepID=A0A5A9N0R9_9TELE|nr:hypothetical protein E1301_Tti016541 [Triplophysa tibetana]